jgi:hypothetical protein
MVSGSYAHKPDVDMSGYVPLDGRVVGACRCAVCSSDSVIKRWYDNDFFCRFDGGLCYDDGKCYVNHRVAVGVRKGKVVWRVMVTKCKRCADGLR